MSKMIIFAILIIGVFFVALNSSMLADQAVSWVQDNPKDPNAPKVLYYAGRWCDLLGDNNKAIATYLKLYQLYPEQGELCANALYNSAEIQVETTSAPKMANDYLQIIFDHYSTVTDWDDKAKELYDEVNHGH
jgi:hypothetical protein